MSNPLDASTSRRLLVVQRFAAVGRSLGRFFAPYFDVEVAQSPFEANKLLRNRPTPLADVICGEDFGPGVPSGRSWIRGLRAAGTVGRVVLATAVELPRRVPGVDLVVEKPLDPRVILDFLEQARVEPVRGVA
jgi:hypothetical protein